jgi:dTDP-4-amino-4,6-dideoxygalactose transaminase
MIPRLKPFLGWEEIFSPCNHRRTVSDFETAFARQFGAKYAIAFPYGRSALWAFFKSLAIENAEIVQPAYTCSVVAHATILSGNIPVFVDCTLDDYNMDLSQFADAITERTRAVIPTHIFGYPLDVDTVAQIVHAAEKKYGHKIWIIQDCAHSFGAEWNGQPVVTAGDGALFGLGISKLVTSIFGGMFTSDDDLLAEKLAAYRDLHFQQRGWMKSLRRYLYLLAVYPAFATALYGLVYWLQERTPFLNQLTKAYHLDEKIHFPPDHLDQMTRLEAAVGIAQLEKYSQIIQRRRSIADAYFKMDGNDPDIIFPPRVAGATYSHFAIRTTRKKEAMAYFAEHGIQLGELIEYSMPHHPAYQTFAQGKEFPNSLLCSQSMINLPIHPGLKPNQVEKIASQFEQFLAQCRHP